MDKVLEGSPWPFAWVKQTDVRWRVTDGETPFTDECCWIRPPTQIALKAGWNHVKLTSPKTVKAWGYAWKALFMPILGTSDHPREVPGLEYRSSPPEPIQ